MVIVRITVSGTFRGMVRIKISTDKGTVRNTVKRTFLCTVMVRITVRCTFTGMARITGNISLKCFVGITVKDMVRNTLKGVVKGIARITNKGGQHYNEG